MPITPATVFQIGSISKQFTAMAIAILVEDGKISLDDDIHQYIPGIPDFGEKITIRHLVHHTSGLRSLDEVKLLATGQFEDITLFSENMELLGRQRELNFKPGEKHVYCNTGYTVMAAIVEHVSGKSMRQFCEERLFKPLGMQHTLFHDNYRMVTPGLAQSYAALGQGVFEREALLHAMPGSTSLLTTVEDLLYWDQEFYSGRVVGKAVIDQMHEVGVLNDGKPTEYAFGIHISQYRGLKTVSHGGADAGYRANLLRFPDQHFTVIVLSNLSNANPGGLAQKVADLYLEDKFTEAVPVLEKPVPIQLPVELLKSLAGFYYNPDSGVGPGYRLEEREGKLYILMGSGFELTPLAEDLFSMAGVEAYRFKFDCDDKGTPRLNLLAGGDVIPFLKVEDVHPDAAQLETYAGRYYSEEMDAYLPVNVRDGLLCFKLKRKGDMPMQATIQDGFAVDFSSVVGAPYALTLSFFRENGNVSGFRVSTGRARNLKFVKL